ncbi:substrate-binding periplasmic protein [Cognaticolwellia mytili]|uniref:substrate-binding periplasmic protein n=1 Tax=Cognaticolwellia mytili TaxID=1888913 RepID=UPI000A16F331|nr:transporter substrate-binding domain-containing protein [Cognaticolwellia mytili]
MLKVVLLCLIGFMPLTFAQQLRIVSEEVPPLQMFDANHQPTGAMVEVVNAMLKKAQLVTDINIYPWARSYQLALSEKNTIIFSLFRDTKREKKFHWIGKLYTVKSYLTNLKSRSDIKINRLADANDYSVGTIRGDLAENHLLDNGFLLNENLFISSKYNVLWELLYSGRIDVAFTNSLLWRYEIKSLGLDPKKLKLNYQIPNFASELYIAASLSTDKKIVDALTKALADIKADGSYQRILTKWQM